MLRAEIPAKLEARKGEALKFTVPLRNLTNALLEGMWGADSYDYEVLDAAGQTVSYRGGFLFPAVGYGLRCQALSQCETGVNVAVSLNRINPLLPLPAGEYTVRLQLKDFMAGGIRHDLGTFDIPLTITP